MLIIYNTSWIDETCSLGIPDTDKQQSKFPSRCCQKNPKEFQLISRQPLAGHCGHPKQTPQLCTLALFPKRPQNQTTTTPPSAPSPLPPLTPPPHLHPPNPLLLPPYRLRIAPPTEPNIVPLVRARLPLADGAGGPRRQAVVIR